MKAIHQFVAGFTAGDAISNEAALFRGIFRNWGFDSEIFCEHRCVHKSDRKTIPDIDTFQSNPDDIVLLHLSMGSKVNEVFKNLSCKKAILYHNVTPPRYFELVNKQTASNLARGQRQVADLAGCADINMADSRFNALELENLGYKDVKVLPLVLDFSMLTDDIDAHLVKKLKDGRKNILFVGRCTPNKKIEDLLQVFAYYQKTIEPKSRLIHVGSHAGSERYYNLMTTRVMELGINNVMFTGSITQPELNACYAAADAFLCMSEHEGFCIPLIEGMLHNIPVLAHASAAIPETMDGAGILISERNYELAAELLNQLISNQPLHDAILKKQTARIERYQKRDLQAELKQHLDRLISS
jgi:glycosyltransferase involved in cell wall biosynthesis